MHEVSILWSKLRPAWDCSHQKLAEPITAKAFPKVSQRRFQRPSLCSGLKEPRQLPLNSPLSRLNRATTTPNDAVKDFGAQGGLCKGSVARRSTHLQPNCPSRGLDNALPDSKVCDRPRWCPEAHLRRPQRPGPHLPEPLRPLPAGSEVGQKDG